MLVKNITYEGKTSVLRIILKKIHKDYIKPILFDPTTEKSCFYERNEDQTGSCLENKSSYLCNKFVIRYINLNQHFVLDKHFQFNHHEFRNSILFHTTPLIFLSILKKKI